MGNVIVQLEKKYDSFDCLLNLVEAPHFHLKSLIFEFFCLNICCYCIFNKFRYANEIASLTALQETSQALSLQIISAEERASRCEADLRVEREWRCEMQEKEIKSKESINSLQLHIKQLNDENKEHDRARCELERLRKQWQEAQITLEELGIQLSVSKLQVSELQEKLKCIDQNNVRLMNNDINGSVWSPDNSTSKCKACEREFSLTRRKVHIIFLSNFNRLFLFIFSL